VRCFSALSSGLTPPTPMKNARRAAAAGPKTTQRRRRPPVRRRTALASAATNARSTRPRRRLVLIVTALVISHLDYYNRVLAGLSATTVALLQSSSCSCSAYPHDHVTSALQELHWLPIKQRVDYKLCLLVHKVTVRQAPSYLTGMRTAVTEVPSLSNLRDASNGNYVRHSQDPSEIRREGVFCCSPPCMEPPANRTQADAFHAGFQALKTFLLQTAYCT